VANRLVIFIQNQQYISMETEKKIYQQSSLINDSAVQHALQFLGGKWRISILWSLKDGCRRFGELKRSLSGISEKILVQELKYFEHFKLIKRQPYSETPPKVEYSLTERGNSLVPLIVNIVSWGYADMARQV
jgi:DNA-binding HxlR family transcriptional regulator